MSTFTYYQNPDLSIAWEERDDNDVIVATGGEVDPAATLLPDQAALDAAEAALQAAQDAAEQARQDELGPQDDDVLLLDYVPDWHGSKKHPPLDVNFVTGIDRRLHRKETIVEGELVETIHYLNATLDTNTWTVTYDTPVVRETWTYTREPTGFALSRVHTIEWYLRDGSLHATAKQRVKIYERPQSLREGQIRRKNIVDQMAMDLSLWLNATQTQHANPQDRYQMGRDLIAAHRGALDDFLHYSNPQILTDLTNESPLATDTFGWLNEYYTGTTTVRAFMLAQLDIWAND